MRTKAVLTALGNDRVGVVDDLSRELSNLRLTIEDSRMAALGGRFAIILRLTGDRKDVTELRCRLVALHSKLGFRLEVETDEPEPVVKLGPRYHIECYTTMLSGLNGVTSILKNHNANIENFQTEPSFLSLGGRTTFHMTAHVSIPQDCDVDRLCEELGGIERRHDLDLVVTRLDSSEQEREQVPTVT